jgi:hypothetical protein
MYRIISTIRIALGTAVVAVIVLSPGAVVTAAEATSDALTPLLSEWLAERFSGGEEPPSG